jgi:hypothetical protein
VRHARPIATDNLDIGAVRAGENSGARARFDAVDLSGQQRLVGSGAVLEVKDFQLQPLLLGKAVPAHHQRETGIALGLDHAVLPGLEFLCRYRRGKCPRRIAINLAPADLPKEGSHYDLPIALGLMAAIGANARGQGLICPAACGPEAA